MNSSAEEPARNPIIQITKGGAVISDSDAELALLQEQFEEQHWLLLPKFAEATLLKLIQRKLNETDYRVVARETGVELRPVDCTSYLATELLLNSPRLFRAIEGVTGCDRIACFSGRIYRRPPSDEYFNRWHTDITDEGRMIALSINLSRQPYDGGALNIRSSKTKELLCEVENPGYGDAVIFRIDASLEHRVGRVEGQAPKTALAGWFRSKFDPNSLFGRDPRAS